MTETKSKQHALVERLQRVLRGPLVRVAAREIGLIAAVLVAAALLLSFMLLAGEVLEGDTKKLDLAVMNVFDSSGNPADRIGPPWFEEAVRDLTALGSYTFIIFTVIVVAGYFLMTQRRRLAALMVSAVAGGMLLSNLLKLLFDRPRPEMEHAVRVFTNSFPSGHATLSAVTFLTLAALLSRAQTRRRVKLYFISIAVILTILVGVSRIYLGVHYPTDVLAGWCVGSAWAIACWAAAVSLQAKRSGDEGMRSNYLGGRLSRNGRRRVESVDYIEPLNENEGDHR